MEEGQSDGSADLTDPLNGYDGRGRLFYSDEPTPYLDGSAEKSDLIDVYAACKVKYGGSLERRSAWFYDARTGLRDSLLDPEWGGES